MARHARRWTIVPAKCSVNARTPCIEASQNWAISLRRMKFRLGPQGATMATARKIATIFYVMIRKQVEYDASIWAALDAQQETRYEAKLRWQAERRGFVLVPKTSVPTTTTA